jgi:hypothetical protein
VSHSTLSAGKANLLVKYAQTNVVGHVEMFAKLLEVFKFLRTNLLVKNDEWMALLGRVIWPQLAESITANCLRKVLHMFSSLQLSMFRQSFKYVFCQDVFL